jgi:RNA polymerase sigma factor (sigma-70 family)
MLGPVPGTIAVDRPHAEPPAAEALADRLAAEGNALRLLARRLVGAADSDDLVQEAGVAALAHGDMRRPGAWLAGAVRQLAAMLRRGRRRRAARELSSAKAELDAGADPAAIAAHAELLRDVAAAVEQLDEPFRTVIVLRFWRGLLPDAIAAALRVPRNTVRSRLQRGLERLRARLDRRHGDRARWSAPLAGAAGVRGAAAVAGGAAWWIAEVGMKGKLLAGAVAALGIAVALSWPAPPGGSAAPAVPRHGGTPAVAVVPRGEPRDEPLGEVPAHTEIDAQATPSVVATPAPATPSASVGPWLLRLRVVDDDGLAVADAAVKVWVMRDKASAYRGPFQFHDEAPLLELRSDREGRASARVEPEKLVVAAADGSRESNELLLSRDLHGHDENRLIVEPLVSVRGLVLGAGDAPLAEARVVAVPHGIPVRGF